MQTLIHIGYPKCASSSLQELFLNNENINLIVSRNNKHKESKELIDELILKDNIEFSIRSCQKYLKIMREKFINKNKVEIISEECFTASSVSYADRGSIALRLKELFPNAKILIVIRNQFNVINSRYNHDPNDIYALGLSNKFLNINQWIDKNFERFNRSYLSTYNYFDLIEHYKKIFGKDNVHIGIFEELVTDSNKFLFKLNNFLGRDNICLDNLEIPFENKAIDLYKMSLYSIIKKFKFPKIYKYINPKFKNIIYKIYKKFYKKQEISKNNRERILKVYSNSNKKLIENYGLPLEKYEYPL